MEYQDHRQTFEVILRHIKMKDLKGALNLALEANHNFPQNHVDTLYWCACLYADNGLYDAAVKIFELALDEGVWWSGRTLEGEESLHCLTPNPAYQRYKSRMNALESEVASKSAVATGWIGAKSNENFIVNLHWKNDTIERYGAYFDDVYSTLQKRCLLIQSSQVCSSHGYSWDDEVKGNAEVSKALFGDFSKVATFCGTSQGGRLALGLAIDNAKDYIGIMPAIRDLEMLKQPISKGIRFQWLIGSEDFFLESVKAFHQGLLTQGHTSSLTIVEGTGHYFSDQLKAELVHIL